MQIYMWFTNILQSLTSHKTLAAGTGDQSPKLGAFSHAPKPSTSCFTCWIISCHFDCYYLRPGLLPFRLRRLRMSECLISSGNPGRALSFANQILSSISAEFVTFLAAAKASLLSDLIECWCCNTTGWCLGLLLLSLVQDLLPGPSFFSFFLSCLEWLVHLSFLLSFRPPAGHHFDYYSFKPDM